MPAISNPKPQGGFVAAAPKRVELKQEIILPPLLGLKKIMALTKPPPVRGWSALPEPSRIKRDAPLSPNNMWVPRLTRIPPSPTSAPGTKQFAQPTANISVAPLPLWVRMELESVVPALPNCAIGAWIPGILEKTSRFVPGVLVPTPTLLPLWLRTDSPIMLLAVHTGMKLAMPFPWTVGGSTGSICVP